MSGTLIDKPFTVMIMSGSKRHISYLESTVNSVLNALDDEEKEKTNIFVFLTSERNNNTMAINTTNSNTTNSYKTNTTTNTTTITNHQINELAISKFLPIIHRKDLKRSFWSHLSPSDTWKQYFETEDWVAALKFCSLIPSKWFVLLEDDVKASPHFIKKLEKRLIPNLPKNQTILNTRLFLNGGEENELFFFGFLRIYFSLNFIFYFFLKNNRSLGWLGHK